MKMLYTNEFNIANLKKKYKNRLTLRSKIFSKRIFINKRKKINEKLATLKEEIFHRTLELMKEQK